MCVIKAHYAVIAGYKKEQNKNISVNRDYFSDNRLQIFLIAPAQNDRMVLDSISAASVAAATISFCIHHPSTLPLLHPSIRLELGGKLECSIFPLANCFISIFISFY